MIENSERRRPYTAPKIVLPTESSSYDPEGKGAYSPVENTTLAAPS